jgi:hypothetical protein
VAWIGLMFDAVTALQLMHFDAVFKHFDGDSSNFFNLQTCLGGATVRALRGVPPAQRGRKGRRGR